MNAAKAIAVVKKHPVPFAIAAAVGFFLVSKLLLGIAIGVGLTWLAVKKFGVKA